MKRVVQKVQVIDLVQQILVKACFYEKAPDEMLEA
jgi:hypothetical protein